MIGGEAGSTVSRNWISARSSIRAPFSEMLPLRRGRADLDAGAGGIAVSRATIVAAEAADLPQAHWPIGVGVFLRVVLRRPCGVGFCQLGLGLLQGALLLQSAGRCRNMPGQSAQGRTE